MSYILFFEEFLYNYNHNKLFVKAIKCQNIYNSDVYTSNQEICKTENGRRGIYSSRRFFFDR